MPASESVNDKLAELELLGFGGAELISGTAGAIVSIVHCAVAGVGSVPCLSVARTENVWRPFASDEYRFGDEQLVQLPPSRLQVNDECVLAVNEMDADVDATVPLGADVIVVLGS
jgi:hypothetical protein